MSDTKTRPSANVVESETKTIKKWSEDQDLEIHVFIYATLCKK